MIEYLIALLLKYRYFALFPLAAIEGPLMSILVGFFVRLGYLNFFLAYVILVMGDLVPDTMYYYLGRYGNRKKLMEKYGSRSNLILGNFKLVEKLWAHHGKKTMFFSKLAYGLSTPFLISTGLVNMTFKRFISYTLPITLIQYACLMVIGYFLGHSYLVGVNYLKSTEVLIASIVIIFIISYSFFSRYAKKEIIKMEQEEK